MIVPIKPIIQFFITTGYSDPPIIEIGYNETIYIDVGLLDLITNTFEVVDEEEMTLNVEKERYLKFEVLEYPGGNNTGGKWKVDFNPIVLKREVNIPLKTNVSVSLRSPRLPDEPITSGVLKINITDSLVFENIRLPPEGVSMRWWVWAALSYWGGWGSWSGTVQEDYYEVDILVKVKPYHAVNLETVKYYIFNPDQIASIPIFMQNLGNYKDTFSFRVVSEHDEIRISDPYSITLEPGEKQSTYLGIEFAPNVLDYGTIHNIKIEAFSTADNSTIATETITIESKGVYFSEISIFSTMFLLVLFVIIILFLIFRYKKIKDDICVKPDKPWELPEEKKYLESLKEKDEKKYNEVRKMMDDEYKSSILWYENYVYTISHPKHVKTIKIKKNIIKFFKKKDKTKKIDTKKKNDEKTKTEKNKIKFFKKKDKTKKIDAKKKNDEKTKTEKNITHINKKNSISENKKQKVLRRIKKNQEKQKHKVQKSDFKKGG